MYCLFVAYTVLFTLFHLKFPLITYLTSYHWTFCKSQKKSNGRQLARPLRETYSPSYWHFPQPATEWLPLGSRPKRRIMINEYGSWPTNRHSSSAHGIRLPHLSFPPAGSWPGLPARLSIHETYPLLNMRRSTPVCQRLMKCHHS